MFRTHSRIIAAIVMFFFTWTSGGVFSIAHAAVDAAKKSKAQEQQQNKSEGPEERFSKITEDLEATLADTKTDTGSKKARLKAGRDEINNLDIEMRGQFAATEQKLRAAKLPAEILERHRKFVKHYDDNLNELKGNIERVEKAKNDVETETELRKVSDHLKRVKAPSRHQKLDPNNLPHRQPVVKKREPRMKKEEFEKDIKKDKHAWKSAKRIQVASAGSLAGLLTSSVVNAVVPPTAADLAETVEVQLTPEIRAKALELGNNPVRIYEFVRNNIEFTPTWGSIQGAQMTMLTKQGNAFDTSSLLIALLRAAGIHAHYVTGTITLPIDKVMNWAGGFTDPMAALDFMSSGGIPCTALTEGGKVTLARLETVYVEAWINYRPFRGGKHVNGKGETWIPLDPSYKQYGYTNGIDIKAAVPFDAQSFLTQIQSTATVNESQGYVTGVDSILTQQTMQNYQARVQSYIQQNYPNATVGDVLGKKEIVKKEYPYLLGTLPYRTSIRGTAFTEIPDSLRHKLTFSVTNGVFDETPLAFTKNLAELAGKKITLSYSPATAQDEAVINSYLPRPHADGTPIQPSELPTQLPAYLINVKPELRIDGQVVATGAPVGLGGTNISTMTFSDPAYGSSQITNYIDAGVYQAIGLNLGRISAEQLTGLKTKLEATKAKLLNNDFATMTKDDLIGDLLYTTAMAYHAELGTMNYIAAKAMNVNAITVPSETIFATKLKVMMLWGIPRYISSGGLNMDADYLMQVVKSKDGNSETARQYMLSSGMTSSALEHSVPEQLFSTPESPAQGISTVKALKIANDQGIPIYTVNQANIATVMPQLQVDQQVKDDIQNAVNAGKVVTVSKTNINFNGWIGCGYIITNPETGAGGYMISGGQSGAVMMIALWVLTNLLPLLAFIFGPASIFMLIAVPILATEIQIAGTMAIRAMNNLDWTISFSESTGALYNLSVQWSMSSVIEVMRAALLSAATAVPLQYQLAYYMFFTILNVIMLTTDYMLFFVRIYDCRRRYA